MKEASFSKFCEVLLIFLMCFGGLSATAFSLGKKWRFNRLEMLIFQVWVSILVVGMLLCLRLFA